MADLNIDGGSAELNSQFAETATTRPNGQTDLSTIQVVGDHLLAPVLASEPGWYEVGVNFQNQDTWYFYSCTVAAVADMVPNP